MDSTQVLSQAGNGAVYVVEDDAHMCGLLGKYFEVAGLEAHCFTTGESFLQSKFGNEPSCMILDQDLPGMSGLELQARLKATGFNIPMIFLTENGTIKDAVHAMREGALHYLEKPVDPEVLLKLVREALDIDRKRVEVGALNQKLNSLTRRERDVLNLVVEGLTSREVADQLGRSAKTIQLHRARIMKKLGVSNVSSLVNVVMRVWSGSKSK